MCDEKQCFLSSTTPSIKYPSEDTNHFILLDLYYLLQMASNELQKMLVAKWQGLSEQQKLDCGLPHQIYCTLCGVPFESIPDLHSRDSEDFENEYAWVGYHCARA